MRDDAPAGVDPLRVARGEQRRLFALGRAERGVERLGEERMCNANQDDLLVTEPDGDALGGRSGRRVGPERGRHAAQVTGTAVALRWSDGLLGRGDRAV